MMRETASTSPPRASTTRDTITQMLRENRETRLWPPKRHLFANSRAMSPASNCTESGSNGFTQRRRRSAGTDPRRAERCRRRSSRWSGRRGPRHGRSGRRSIGVNSAPPSFGFRHPSVVSVALRSCRTPLQQNAHVTPTKTSGCSRGLRRTGRRTVLPHGAVRPPNFAFESL
jgi:hypothetical protein